jgi:hypothetical protein
MNLSYVGYTYCIKFLVTGQVYYGSRCAKNCNPNEFWVTYFTSSKLVKSLIEQYGKESFAVEIRKTFTDDPKKAQEWERRVLRRIDAGRKSIFLNKSNGVAPILSGWKNPFYGKRHTDETKEKMKKSRPSMQGDKNPRWKGGKDRRKFLGDDAARQQSHAEYMRRNNPMSNPESRKKLSEAALRRKSLKCAHCDKEFEPGGFSVHTRALAKKGILIS